MTERLEIDGWREKVPQVETWWYEEQAGMATVEWGWQGEGIVGIAGLRGMRKWEAS